MTAPTGRNRKVRLALFLLALAMLALAATALAMRDNDRIELRAGDLIIVGHGGFRPETLPKHHDAPITIHGGGKLSTVSGELPPILETLTIEFDSHGAVDTTGLEVCTAGKLQATDVPAARRACPDAIVGKGFGSAVVALPRTGADPGLLADHPLQRAQGARQRHGARPRLHHRSRAPTTFIVPVVIERIHKGVYGYRTKAKIPKIAGGYGHPISGNLTIGRKWTYKGKKHSYINARCETGHLQARGEFTFKDGTFLKGTFLRPCQVLRLALASTAAAARARAGAAGCARHSSSVGRRPALRAASTQAVWAWRRREVSPSGAIRTCSLSAGRCLPQKGQR